MKLKNYISIFLWPLFLSLNVFANNQTELKILNASISQDDLRIEICHRNYCETLSMAQQTLSQALSLKSGLYNFKVFNQEKLIDTFEYQIGPSKYYNLLLYGYSDKPVRRSLIAKIKNILSGNKKVSEASYQLRHRMVDVSPTKKDSIIKLRVGHLAVGARPIQFEFHRQNKTSQFKALDYQKLSTSKQLLPESGTISARLNGSKTQLINKRINPQTGDYILVIVSQFEGHRARLIVDKRSLN